MIRAALDALAGAGVPYALRGAQPLDGPPPGGDVDVLVAARHARRAGRALRGAGFHRLAVAGHAGHRFHLALDTATGRWVKLDLNLVPRRLGWDLAARDAASLRRHAGYRAGAGRGRTRAALTRRLPAGLRRRGPVVAILGPDGAGKGSVVARLRDEIPIAVYAVYLGEGESAAGYGRAPSDAARRAGRARALRAAAAVLPAGARERQHLIRRALRAALRTRRAHLRAWRGDVVLCDRHPLDGLVMDPDGLGRLLGHGPLARLIPPPDAVVVLDAAGALLHARKGERTPEELERARRRYREVLGPRGAVVVNAEGPLDETVAATSEVVWRALAGRRGW